MTEHSKSSGPASVPSIELMRGTPSPSDRPDEPVNPLALLHALLTGRYWWAAGLSLVGLVVGAVIGYRSGNPTYSSTGMIQIKTVVPKILFPSDQNNSMVASYVESQAAVLRTERVATMAMQNESWKALNRLSTPEAVQTFEKSLHVVHAEGSELVQVTFSDPDSSAAQTGVKSVIGAYQRLAGELDVESENQRLTILDNRRTALGNDLKRVTDQIQQAGQEYATDSLESIYQHKLQQTNALEEEWKFAQVRLSKAQAEPTTQPAAATQPSPLTVDDLARIDPQMRQYVEKRNEQRNHVALLQNRTGRQSTEMLEAQAYLEILEKNVADYLASHKDPSASGAPGSDRAALAALQANEQNLRTLFEAARAETLKLGEKNLQIKNLSAEAENIRQRLDETKARIEQINVESAVSGRITVISAGDNPIRTDRRKPLAGLGALLGAMLGMGLVMFRGLLDRRFRNAGDAQSKIAGVNRLLGVLPVLPTDFSDPEQATMAAHCVHHIRSLLQLVPGGGKRRVYAVTSPVSGDGKTSLTFALGLSFSASGLRTLMIDSDIIGGGLSSRVDVEVQSRIGRVLVRQGLVTEPQVRAAIEMAQKLKLRLGEMLVKLGTISTEQLEQALATQRGASAGLLDLIAGEPARNCIAETAMPNLWILPRGSVSAHQEVRLSPEAVRLLIETVRDQYDIVLVDTGPVPGTLGASIMNSLVDGVVVVLSRGAGRTQTQRAVNHLTLIGASIVGYVFNRAENRDFQVSYGSSISSPSVEKSRSGSQFDIEMARRGAKKYGPVVSAVACSVDGPSRDPITGMIRKTQPSP